MDRPSSKGNGLLPERLATVRSSPTYSIPGERESFRALRALQKAGVLGVAILLLNGPLRLLDIQDRLGVSLNPARYHARGLERAGLARAKRWPDGRLAYELEDASHVSRLIEELYPGWHHRAAVRVRFGT
jgi:hypothetical protein